MKQSDPKTSYRTGINRKRIYDYNKFKTLRYDDRTSDFDSDITDININAKRRTNMYRIIVVKIRIIE
jgi:hypothetical protein